MFNAFLQSVMSIALILKVQKNLTTKETFFEKMFRLLFKKLKCRIRSKIIKKCKLSSLSFSISNIFIWRIDDLYCDILANESRFIQKLEIRRTNNFVRLMMFQNEKSLLIDKHEHFCELFQILFTDEFKIVIERIVKFDQYIDQKMTSLKQNYAIFLQLLKKWTMKQIVWKYATVLNWYTSNFKNYLWSFESKEIYNLLNEWKFVVTEKQTDFKKSLSIIDEFFESINRFFLFQRQLRSFEYSLNKNKNLHMLKNQFVQMSMYFRRLIEKNKNTNVSKSNLSQKSFQINSKCQFAFKTTMQKFFQIESISKLDLKSITFQKFFRIDLNFVLIALVFKIRFIFHKDFQSIQFFFDAQLIVSFSNFKIQSKYDVRFLTNINQHDFVSSIQSLTFPSSIVQFVFDFFKINAQLTLNYLSNRHYKSNRHDAWFSFAYFLSSIDFVLKLSESSLFYKSNILDIKFNATNLNLNSNDSDDVVKLTQIRLYSTIDFINSSIWFIIQMISIKKISNSFESNNFKRSRSKNVNFEFIEKKFPKWKFEYYIESFETDYFFYFDKLKEKDKKKTNEIKWIKHENVFFCCCFKYLIEKIFSNRFLWTLNIFFFENL